jgi:hypothetical protein
LLLLTLQYHWVLKTHYHFVSLFSQKGKWGL